MNAQIISIILIIFNVAANAIPLTNKKKPRTKIKPPNILRWKTPNIQKHNAINTSNAPSILTIMILIIY